MEVARGHHLAPHGRELAVADQAGGGIIGAIVADEFAVRHGGRVDIRLARAWGYGCERPGPHAGVVRLRRRHAGVHLQVHVDLTVADVGERRHFIHGARTEIESLGAADGCVVRTRRGVAGVLIVGRAQHLDFARLEAENLPGALGHAEGEGAVVVFTVAQGDLAEEKVSLDRHVARNRLRVGDGHGLGAKAAGARG